MHIAHKHKAVLEVRLDALKGAQLAPRQLIHLICRAATVNDHGEPPRSGASNFCFCATWRRGCGTADSQLHSTSHTGREKPAFRGVNDLHPVETAMPISL